jgi:1-acyl-sn-glycerol-3-phosphate acyltransferase
MIRTAIVGIFLSVVALTLGLPFVLLAVITRSADILYKVGLTSVLIIVRAVGVRTRVEGVENIPPETCLFAANHTSNADPPAIVGAIPRRIAILAKKSLFSIPVVGPAFRIARFVPVNRQKHEDAVASLELAAEYMREGTSFLIYPEGTRSPDGRLQQFKRGAFVLAIKAGVPVVPVACAGAHRIMPKKSWRTTPGEIVVRFCPPIDAREYSLDRRSDLAERVHAAIAAALPPDQQPLSTPAAERPARNTEVSRRGSG